jgi:two-component system cell cycle response regulator/two-component system cell cycle response regulator DivK
MSKTILIVEDFDDSRSFMKFLLEGLGYKVLEATDGFRAVEVAKRHVPDLILMDMALPLINGVSATKIIRQFKETSQIPIIAVTASGQFIYNQAMEAGCNDMILKPLDIDKLQPVIERHLAEKVNS